MTAHDDVALGPIAWEENITADHLERFGNDGDCVLDSVLSEDLIALLEEECDRAIAMDDMTVVRRMWREFGTAGDGSVRRMQGRSHRTFECAAERGAP